MRVTTSGRSSVAIRMAKRIFLPGKSNRAKP
jgi:hypothetical protein